jgi:hypothetical protein
MNKSKDKPVMVGGAKRSSGMYKGGGEVMVGGAKRPSAMYKDGGAVKNMADGGKVDSAKSVKNKAKSGATSRGMGAATRGGKTSPKSN